MSRMQKIGKMLMRIYVGIGAASMGLLTVLVIFTVIARYCFSLSWKSVSEFNVVLFAFTTFWAMGINVITDEHVSINILYDRIKPSVKRWVCVFNCVIMLITDALFVYYSYAYTMKMGKQISQGMEIPMYYMYGIMPVCGVLCAVCILVKIVISLRAPLSAFEPKDQAPAQTAKE